MSDAVDDVRDHYRATGLTERLKAALAVFGPDDQRLMPRQLAALDQFHTRGLAATAELPSSPTSPPAWRCWMSAPASAARRVSGGDCGCG